MQIKSDEQRTYFNTPLHRFDESLVLDPTPAQTAELDCLNRTMGISTKQKHTPTFMDFGCGSGRVTFYFLKLGYNIIGVDISEKSLRSIEKKYTQYKQPHWGKLIISTHLPSGKVDGIVGADILHHVRLDDYIPQFFAMLKTGGKIAFSEPNALHLPWYAYLKLQGIPFDIEKGILQCTYFNLTNTFAKYGFGDISIHGHGLYPTMLLDSIAPLLNINIHVLGNLPFLKVLAFRLITVATKK